MSLPSLLLTVCFPVYITGGLATTLYMNTSAKRAARASQEHQDLAHAAVESLDEKNSGSKSNTDVSRLLFSSNHFFYSSNNNTNKSFLLLDHVNNFRLFFVSVVSSMSPCLWLRFFFFILAKE